MSEEVDETAKEKTSALGVSSFLPRTAAEMLVRAARVARTFPVDTIERRREIDDAVQKVRLRWPSFFRSNRRGR